MKFHKPPTTYVGKVSLKVADLARSIKFYEKVIGFKVLEKKEREVSFTADGKTVLLLVEQLETVEHKIMQTAGLYHFALLLPDRSDLANIVRHFVNLGIRFGSGDHLVSEALYLSDPDGNGIEIYADRPDANWNWEDDEVEMTTDPVDFENLLSTEYSNGWRGLPVQTVIGHIHLQVGDLDENEQFYINGLGFEMVNRYGSQALFVSDNKYHHHIAFNTWSGLGIPNLFGNMVGIKSYSIIFPDEETRIKTVKQLQSIDAIVEKKDSYFVTYDPSNIPIELKIYK